MGEGEGERKERVSARLVRGRRSLEQPAGRNINTHQSTAEECPQPLMTLRARTVSVPPYPAPSARPAPQLTQARYTPPSQQTN